ncbi:hypothetical protein LX32DRAFT_338726 [Colletotrichum zoysiae]|uniref:Uncharacterized protein n=1 Tax=Colletotrichum zoysiae TaxID=1216348 RepID=A0AAD9LTZ9_9PEZI|nr:hypothetical protein LX32DRAFT_338726 [Colletotrichum zoysiae]
MTALIIASIDPVTKKPMRRIIPTSPAESSPASTTFMPSVRKDGHGMHEGDMLGGPLRFTSGSLRTAAKTLCYRGVTSKGEEEEEEERRPICTEALAAGHANLQPSTTNPDHADGGRNCRINYRQCSHRETEEPVALHRLCRELRMPFGESRDTPQGPTLASGKMGALRRHESPRVQDGEVPLSVNSELPWDSIGQLRVCLAETHDLTDVNAVAIIAKRIRSGYLVPHLSR